MQQVSGHFPLQCNIQVELRTLSSVLPSREKGSQVRYRKPGAKKVCEEEEEISVTECRIIGRKNIGRKYLRLSTFFFFDSRW